jgi:formamidopyrimidine-DNA glycosylase
MLAGELVWCEPSVRLMASTVFVFDMESGKQLRYIDQKEMGQMYYLSPEQRSEIVRLENQEPDVIDEHLSFDQFVEGLRPFGGEVKGVLTRALFLG